MKKVREYDSSCIAHTYRRNDIILAHGKNELLYDENEKEYIDLGSGIGVNIFGAADDILVAAAERQMKLIQHASNLYYTKPCAMLAFALCEKTGMKKVFFGNSGAEANECAIKTARKYSHDKYGENRYRIVTLVNSFHGRTVTTLSATGQEAFHRDFSPFTEGFDYCEADNIPMLEAMTDGNGVCAIMLEIIQGEGGVNLLSGEFISRAAQLCKEKDILLIIDEVQTGNGRTGKYFSYMHYGLQPDIVTTAKGLGGGFPIGACLFGSKTQDVLQPSDHGSTFGGNPVCCAAALSVVERIDDRLCGEVTRKGKLIFSAFENEKNVVSVSGLGLMVGIETTKNASDIAKKCMERGVLVLTAKNKVRLLPPLNIRDENLLKALKVIKEAIAE